MSVMKLRTSVSRLHSHLQTSYALDLRSLALFRIGVGLVVLVDLVRRFQHSLVLYSDAGVLPRVDALSGLSIHRWSLLFAGGTPEFVNAIFVAGFIAAIAMILGWKTRIATIILWIILVSVQSRNYHLNSGADTLIRVTMFWAMLLPLGKMWSLDRYVSRSDRVHVESGQAASVVANLATFGLILQTASVYQFTAILKDGPRWREEGSALYYALGARDLSTGLGDWLFRNAPEWILSSLTFGTLLMEFVVPIMLLLPLRSGWLRTVGAFLIFGLHIGIFVTMTVGVFPVISIAGAIGILPTWFWKNVAARTPAPGPLTTQWHRAWGFIESLMPMRPEINTAVATRYPQDDSGVPISGSSHILRFTHQPDSSRPALGTIALNVIAALAIVMMLGWNLQTVSAHTVTGPLRQATIALGLNQKWSMFAPGPQVTSIWYVAEGELESGDKVDVLIPIYTGDVSLRNPVVMDQSEDMQMKNKYWRKYFHSIRSRDTEQLRFAAYTCRTWNAENSGEERLARVTLIRAYARTLPEGERAEPVYDQLGSWRCL